MTLVPVAAAGAFAAERRVAVPSGTLLVLRLAPGGGVQPFASLLQVLRAGLQQAFGHGAELADAGGLAVADLAA